MGLIKRPIGFLLEKLLPEVEGVPPHNILPKVPAPPALYIQGITQLFVLFILR
jgi:hypothetical protein